MKLRPFELTLLAVFGFLAIGAVVLLKIGPIGGGDETLEEYVGAVEIWGTIPSAPINRLLIQVKADDEIYESVTYRYVPKADFNSTLIEALADGTGPDLIFASHEELVEQRKRILSVSYESWPLGDFRDTYLEGAQVFALSDGIYGTPMLVDPLMMYWNKDILTNNGFLTAPKTWEELVNVQLPAMVERGFDRSVLRAVLAFGIYENTENAFGTLSALLIQSGSQLVSENITGSSVAYNVKLNQAISVDVTPFTNSLSFYLRFGQPANTLYSWNRSFSSDRTEFISEDLVFYFGYGSEGKEIEELNPNLNFDIAEIPQGADADLRRTYGKIYALSALRSADNVSGAFKVISRLHSDNVLDVLAYETNMVPAKRNLAAKGSNDLYARVAYRSAPIAYGWLNPNYQETNEIFSETISDVNENRNTVNAATKDAVTKITRLYD